MGSILVIYTKNWTYCIYSNAKYKDIINMHFAIRSLLFHQSCNIVSTRMVNVTGLNQSHFFPFSVVCFLYLEQFNVGPLNKVEE